MSDYKKPLQERNQNMKLPDKIFDFSLLNI
jgi:hypothetical protein